MKNNNLHEKPSQTINSRKKKKKPRTRTLKKSYVRFYTLYKGALGHHSSMHINKERSISNNCLSFLA